jgi:hypothetical protein
MFPSRATPASFLRFCHQISTDATYAKAKNNIQAAMNSTALVSLGVLFLFLIEHFPEKFHRVSWQQLPILPNFRRNMFRVSDRVNVNFRQPVHEGIAKYSCWPLPITTTSGSVRIKTVIIGVAYFLDVTVTLAFKSS